MLVISSVQGGAGGPQIFSVSGQGILASSFQKSAVLLYSIDVFHGRDHATKVTVLMESLDEIVYIVVLSTGSGDHLIHFHPWAVSFTRPKRCRDSS